jgi:hypothetical protein
MPKEPDPIDDRQAVKQPEMELEPIPITDEAEPASEMTQVIDPRPDEALDKSGHQGNR